MLINWLSHSWRFFGEFVIFLAPKHLYFRQDHPCFLHFSVPVLGLVVILESLLWLKSLCRGVCYARIVDHCSLQERAIIMEIVYDLHKILLWLFVDWRSVLHWGSTYNIHCLWRHSDNCLATQIMSKVMYKVKNAVLHMYIPCVET